MKLARTSVLAVLVFALTTTAYAGLVPVGDPFPGTWEQTWNFDAASVTGGSFNLLAFRMRPGPDDHDDTDDPYFESTATSASLFDFTTFGWGILYEDQTAPSSLITLASATGPTITAPAEVAFKTRGDSVQIGSDLYPPPVFDFVAFAGDSLVYQEHVKWQIGTGWVHYVYPEDDGTGEGQFSDWWGPDKIVVDPDNEVGDISVIPAPGALLLGVIGVGLVAAARRRRR